MKPNSLTVFELFERQQRYVVPLFQRPYVWTREKQWQPLWEDISSKADQILSLKEKVNNHFLGAIVLNPILTKGLEVSAKTIIDGQQRITTLQIILIAMRDFARAINYEGIFSTLELHTENHCRLDQQFERYKVWPTNADRVIFEAVYQAGSPDRVSQNYPLIRKKHKIHPEPLPLLVDAYLYFYKSIQVYVQPEEIEPGAQEYSPIEKYDALVEAFKRHLEIVTIDLEEKDNPQVIFESLNYRGEPLTPSDLIRNFVFLEAGRLNEPVEELYKKYWFDYDRRAPNGNAGFWLQTEKQGRLNRQRLDLFVFHHLVYKTGLDIAITRLFQEFKEWWEADKRNVEFELQSMQKYSLTFSGFYAPDITTRTGVFERRLRMLDISTIYPLLLFLLVDCKDTIPANELDGIMVDLESYLIRRMVCGLTTKNYNRIFLSLLNNLRKPGIVVSRKEIRRLILENQADSARFPDDREFDGSWMSRDIYNAIGHRAKIVLEAIDLQLKTSKQEEVHIDGPLTLEHLMPQAWKEADYPLPELKNEDNEDLRLSHRAGLLHTFGNLTLLTQALNSAISNGAFDAKLAEIRRHSLLRINGEYIKQGKNGSWTEDDIITRGKNLLKIAKQIWPYPI
jgi:hypothetical protein